jgi:hypothetical protein
MTAEDEPCKVGEYYIESRCMVRVEAATTNEASKP